MRDSRTVSGRKPKIGEQVNATLEALELTETLDAEIERTVNDPKHNPKLLDKIVMHRLQHGKQPDPHDEFAHMTTAEFRDNVLLRFAKTIHPNYRDQALMGVKEHLQALNLFHNCTLYEEGQIKKKLPPGTSASGN
jgi:hypothetical protein